MMMNNKKENKKTVELKMGKIINFMALICSD